MLRNALLFCAVLAGAIAAAPGDLVRQAVHMDRRWSDIAFGAGGTLWALDEMNGTVTPIAADLSIMAGGTLAHPFGASSPLPPFQPVCRGLAFDAARNELIVLNATTTQVVRLSAAGGAQTGDPITLQAPDGAGLEGLTYDAAGNVLWSVDSRNDRLIGFDAATGEVRTVCGFPGDDPPETTLYGTGVAYVLDGTAQYLSFLWGDIFDMRADTILRMDPSACTVAPFAVPLAACGEGVTRALAATPQRAVVLLSLQGGASRLCEIDCAAPAILGPSHLVCAPQETSDMHLTWANNGPGEDGAYSEIVIARNGTPIAQLSGAARAFVDHGAPEGMLTYEVRARQGLTQLIPARRRLQNRRGAILGWIPFPGGTISGIAVDPDTGDVWVTDKKPVATNRYRIWRFTADLALVASVEVTQPGPPYGITFWPNAPVSNPPETVLVVGNETTNSVQRMTREGVFVGGAVPLRMPESEGQPSPKTGSLAFDPHNGAYFLAVLDTANNRIVWLDRYGFPASEGSSGVRIQCRPSALSGIVPAWGIDRSPASGFFHVGVNTGSLHEINTHCAVTRFELNPRLPTGPGGTLTVKDFAYSGNVVYVASPATGAIFKMLAYPIGNPFLRGDVNGDAAVNVADVLAVLMYLFEGATAPGCLDAADVNDDGRIDISDPVYLLFYLFGGGPPPEPPYPEPGLDPTLDDPFTC